MKALKFFVFALAGTMLLACKPDDDYVGKGGNNGDNGGNGQGQGGKEEVVAQNLGGTMSENTTLKDLGLAIDYIIDGTLNLDGNAMLTIEPGVCIAFTGSNGEIKVGENCGINWVGTEKKPIVLRGPVNNNNPGSWNYVDLYSRRSDNKLEYVQFLNGGASESYAPLCIEDGARVSIRNCSFEGSLGYGIWSCGAITAFENNTIKGAQKDAMYINVDDNALGKSAFGTGNAYKDNKRNRIFLDNFYLTEGELTFTNQGIPYFLNSGLDLNGEFTLTIDPGVNIIMGDGQSFTVEEKARLYAKGTAGAPIIFCGEEDEPGSWNWLDVCTTKACELESVIVDGAGRNGAYGAVIYESSKVALSMKNVVIRNSDAYGVYMMSIEGTEQEDGSVVYTQPGKFSYENVSFDNNTLGNVCINYGEPMDDFPW